MRIVIAGGPRTGKTTLAEALSFETGVPIYHTDDLIDLGWSEASEEASKWFDLKGDWIIEGVAAPRALRKWLERTPESQADPPFDGVLFLAKERENLTPGQATMAKGCRTVFDEISDELDNRSIEISTDDHGPIDEVADLVRRYA